MNTGREARRVVMVTTRIGVLERSHRVLLLDGDSAERAALGSVLAGRSCTVRSAGDATRGLRLLLDELLELDVLVVDLDLPHRDARSLTHLVRRAGGERELAIVVVAGDLAPDRRAELHALGVDAIADRRDGRGAVADVVLGVLAARRAPSHRLQESPSLASDRLDSSFGALPDFAA